MDAWCIFLYVSLMLNKFDLKLDVKFASDGVVDKGSCFPTQPIEDFQLLYDILLWRSKKRDATSKNKRTNGGSSSVVAQRLLAQPTGQSLKPTLFF